MTNKFNALCAILCSKRRYALIGGENALVHQAVFRADVRDALSWVSGGCTLAIAILWLHLGRPLFDASNTGKWIAFAGIFTAGLATWFALATPEDTWDLEGRLDTALRGFFFKVFFFPGLVASVVGTFW